MNTEYQNYAFLNKNLVTSSLLLSLLAHQAEASPKRQSLAVSSKLVTMEAM